MSNFSRDSRNSISFTSTFLRLRVLEIPRSSVPRRIRIFSPSNYPTEGVLATVRVHEHSKAEQSRNKVTPSPPVSRGRFLEIHLVHVRGFIYAKCHISGPHAPSRTVKIIAAIDGNKQASTNLPTAIFPYNTDDRSPCTQACLTLLYTVHVPARSREHKTHRSPQ